LQYLWSRCKLHISFGTPSSEIHARGILQCFWGSGAVKRHATQQQVETLRHHIAALDDYASGLKSQLEQYRTLYGDLLSPQEHPPYPPPVSQDDHDWGGWESGSASEKDDIDELVNPTEHLKVSVFSPYLHFSLV
jgi:hypothetical protein